MRMRKKEKRKRRRKRKPFEQRASTRRVHLYPANILIPIFQRLGNASFPGDHIFPKLFLVPEFAMKESHFSVMM